MFELFIETLTGTAFELRVSPYETVMSVKAKIQRLEGIPISHQHLIWQTTELEDDNTLEHYNIGHGMTLKLVLAMRGGPINTKRVPIPLEDPTLREMAEFMDQNKDELLERFPGNKQVTIVVYRDGDHLRFFRVADRGDGTLSPLSDSGGISKLGVLDDEDGNVREGSSKFVLESEENSKTKEKMKKLKDKITDKKPNNLPRPPSSGRPSSRGRLRAIQSRFRPEPLMLASRQVAPRDVHNTRDGLLTSAARRRLDLAQLERVREDAKVAEVEELLARTQLEDEPESTSPASVELLGELRLRSGPLDLDEKNFGTRTSSLLERTPSATGRTTRSGSSLRNLHGIPRPPVSGKRNVRYGGMRSSGVLSPTTRLPPVRHKKKKRCTLCGKKTGLATSYNCRCGNNFCAQHRYAEEHGCSFDYKTEGRRLLEQSNPVVSAPKLPKI